jgi:hypothetical protein
VEKTEPELFLILSPIFRYSLCLYRFMFRFNSSVMGLVGQVNVAYPRFVTSDALGYIRDAYTLAAKICNFVALFAGEMDISSFYHTLRIL